MHLKPKFSNYTPLLISFPEKSHSYNVQLTAVKDTPENYLTFFLGKGVGGLQSIEHCPQAYYLTYDISIFSLVEHEYCPDCVTRWRGLDGLGCY